MIESARFTNVHGDFIDFNDLAVPFNEFTTEVDWRFTEKNKSQEHGIYPGSSYLGKRLFHCTGDILQNTSAEYWTKRRQFVRAILPRSHMGYKEVGTLSIRFTGYSEDISAECTLDGWPEMPLQGLSPSAGKFQVNFKSFDPRLYGALQSVDLPFSLTQNIGGRGYNKTYNKTYAAGLAGNDALVTNSGDIETYPVIRIYGPAYSPRITLLRSDNKVFYFFLNGLQLLNASDVVVVDMGKHTAIMNGGINVYSYAAGATWWALEPSPYVNTVRYTADSASAPSHAIVEWRNAYMI